MVAIAQRYLTARSTSDLKLRRREDPEQAAAEVLTAAGMVAQEHEAAMMLWEVTFRGKTSAKLALVDILASKLIGHMIRERLQGDPRSISRAVLAWWLHGVCTTCGGVGHELVPHTIVRADEPCSACQGTGKLPQPQDEAFRWLADEMGELQSIAGGKVMRKLSVDMDL